MAHSAELPTFKIHGRLIRMQALCALVDVAAASQEADRIDTPIARFDRPPASLFTAWFRRASMHGPPPPGGTEMPGFRIGLNTITKLPAVILAGTGPTNHGVDPSFWPGEGARRNPRQHWTLFQIRPMI